MVNFQRAPTLYVETRFLILVQGLEALHREMAGDQPPNGKLQAKIDRILAQVEHKKDREWLENRLLHAGEFTLPERLDALFSALPVALDTKRVREFCSSCANLRNDLAHVGGKRVKSAKADYLGHVHAKSNALSFFYQLIILREIGVGDDLLTQVFDRGPRSIEFKEALREVDLLPTALSAHSGRFG